VRGVDGLKCQMIGSVTCSEVSHDQKWLWHK